MKDAYRPAERAEPVLSKSTIGRQEDFGRSKAPRMRKGIGNEACPMWT
jgi:hypothetical protein